jgi:hypothetical protein
VSYDPVRGARERIRRLHLHLAGSGNNGKLLPRAFSAVPYFVPTLYQRRPRFVAEWSRVVGLTLSRTFGRTLYLSRDC